MLLALAAATAGCLHRPALARFDAATPITLVVLVDRKDGTHFEDVPAELTTALDRELARRNLVAEPASHPVLAAIGESRSSKTRAELLAKALGANRLFLLVELKTSFFGQFEGGYKWNVDAELTVGQSDAVDEVGAASVGVPAFLEQESEGEREALQQAASGLADHLGILLDDHFAGRLSGPAPGPASAAGSAKP